jgi:hypothetical protein
MGGAAQVAMHVASQIWQVVFALQTFQVFCLALRKKAQYVVVFIDSNVSIRWKQRKSKELGHVPWLVALQG